MPLMMLLRCALLCSIACGSPHTRTVESPGESPVDSPVADRAKPIALAIVLEGWEMWVGNDQRDDVPEHERYPGVLKPFRDGFARVSVTGFPAGSMATVVTYADKATARHPMQPIEKLAGAAFGEQKDYFDSIERDLVGGVTLGLDELAKVQDARRVLVVLGDGSDSHVDTAKGALAELGKRAAAENVEILSLVYSGPLSSPVRSISGLDPKAVSVNTVDAIVDQLGWLFARLKQPPMPANRGGNEKAPLPLALALLVSGSEVWIGNDDFTPANDPSRYVGALKAIRAAIERAPMTGFPRGAKAMVVTYDSSAQVRVPLGPIESFDARAVGVQRDYYGKLGSELVSGVTLAFTELAKVEAKRRVLVVVGDGADTNNEVARTQLRELAKRAAESHIEIHAIVYKGALSDESTVVTVLDPNARTVSSADELTAQLADLFTRSRTK